MAAIIQDVALNRALQANHVPQQRALSGTAVAHDDEYRAARHSGGNVPHDDERAVGHGQVLNLNFGFFLVHSLSFKCAAHCKARRRCRPKQ